jgi:hypothetical protein
MGVPRRVSLNSAFHAPLVYTFLPTEQTVRSFYPGNRGNRRISFRETSLLASTISFVGMMVVVKSRFHSLNRILANKQRKLGQSRAEGQ